MCVLVYPFSHSASQHPGSQNSFSHTSSSICFKDFVGRRVFSIGAPAASAGAVSKRLPNEITRARDTERERGRRGERGGRGERVGGGGADRATRARASEVRERKGKINGARVENEHGCGRKKERAESERDGKQRRLVGEREIK
jgi:hypothetical protein